MYSDGHIFLNHKTKHFSIVDTAVTTKTAVIETLLEKLFFGEEGVKRGRSSLRSSCIIIAS